MPLQVDGDTIGEVYVGADPITEGWVWDGAEWAQVYSSVPPDVSPMGMYLTASFTFNTTSARVAPMAAMAGRPATSIVENALVADGPGVRTIVARFQPGSTYQPTYRLMRNGVQLATGANISVANVEIAAGDMFWLEARNGFGNGSVTAGESSTFLYWD